MGPGGVYVNHHIKVLDRVQLPLAADVKRAIRAQTQKAIGVTVGVEAAHRAVQVREADWLLHACTAGIAEDVSINTCGTYGIASAAYWWGRLAAIIHRALFHITGPSLPLWALLFADDWSLSAGGPNFVATLLIAIWAMPVFKVTVSWPTCPGWKRLIGVGYELNFEELTLGISDRRASWLLGWLLAYLGVRSGIDS